MSNAPTSTETTAQDNEKKLENSKNTPRDISMGGISMQEAYGEDGLKNAMMLDGMSGIGTFVLFEFPANDYENSVYFLAVDIISVSHSVSRAKIPVTNLGQVSLSGIALGTKMVAGSIIKLFHRNDSLSRYIKTFVDRRFEYFQTKVNHEMSLDDIESNITFKEFSDYMRDDIAPFNIHLIHMSEPSTELGGIPIALPPRITSIIGATIINTGKVFSVENLITEETLSFIAKTVIYTTDNLHPEWVSNQVMTGSKLIGMRHDLAGVPQSLENYRSFYKGMYQSSGWVMPTDYAYSGFDPNLKNSSNVRTGAKNSQSNKQ